MLVVEGSNPSVPTKKSLLNQQIASNTSSSFSNFIFPGYTLGYTYLKVTSFDLTLSTQDSYERHIC
ncbi:protein of unknown function [Legionella micdadei]|uniref:Uncharacterized protein n=1 Tax=Legionella micdadei TaxID=451 RepID=A0A098GB55_LEGMI|nr:protein of unknown function [Legionella micdadei]